MNWIYENKEIEKISDFPDNTYGFVYRILHKPTGKAYIGKKVLQFTRKVKLTKKELAEFQGVVGRRPAYRLAVKESDWQTYYGSSVELTADIAQIGIDKFTREILHYCKSKAETSYIEAREQFDRKVLESDDYYNGHIQVRVHGSHIKSKI